MARPKQEKVPPFSKDEKVMCFHGHLLYEAKVLDVKIDQGKNVEDARYLVHYKGWKASWDDWVSHDRILKLTEETRQLAAQLEAQARMRAPGGKGKRGAKATGSEMSSTRGSEERAAVSSSFAGRGPRRGRDYELETEEAFHARPSIKLVTPDALMGLLVDDWENVSKNSQLVPLPHPKPITKILEDYSAYEMPKRVAGSSNADILEETLCGVKEYFDKTLSRILLYKFERLQYTNITKKLNSTDPDFQGKTVSDIYGAEHLCRLLVELPELVAQTNMDQQSVNRLREEITKLATWLSRHTKEYFSESYETPGHEYMQIAKK
ncbi:MRG-domain-containing protein [Xylaria sp. CBS 124048]|nr:MRG-domain-containing protein [Xylaria sp. CBS 124048]